VVLINLVIFLKKITIIEDSEPFEKNTRSGYKKPHTVYGILWDEYLKHTYGFSINFLNFNKKIKNNEKNKNYSYFLSFWNKNFKKKIEKSLNIIDKQTGLSFDSNLANEITSRFLPKSGFLKSFMLRIIYMKNLIYFLKKMKN
jgi:hypothetical protein